MLWKPKTISAETIIPTSDTTITFFAPTASSINPKRIVANPDITFARIANKMTWPEENPNDVAAMMPPNANTPARPSRKIADAKRNRSTFRSVRHNLATSEPTFLYEPTIPRALCFSDEGFSGMAKNTGNAKTSHQRPANNIATRILRPSSEVTPNQPAPSPMFTNPMNKMTSRTMPPRYPAPHPMPEIRPRLAGEEIWFNIEL